MSKELGNDHGPIWDNMQHFTEENGKKNMLDFRRDFFFPVALRPNAGHGLLIPEVSRSHTTTHHSR